MVGNDYGGLQESRSTFSFQPFILMLFRDELVKLIEKCGKEFPNADIQMGEKRLEHKIQFKDDVDLLSNWNNSVDKTFHHLYISLRTSASSAMAASMILEITPYNKSLYIHDRQDEKTSKLAKEIRKLIQSRDPYRFVRNTFVNIAIYAVDFVFLFYIVFLKDMIEKVMNFPMPDLMMLIFVLLLNSTFLVPRGKNRIYLKNSDQIGFFEKYTNFAVTCGIYFLALVNLVLIVLKLVKVI